MSSPLKSVRGQNFSTFPKQAHLLKGGAQTILPIIPYLQWLIIQGRAEGKVLDPSARNNVLDFFGAPLQQLQPEPCPSDFDVAGACDDRSLVPIAVRVPASIMAKKGVVKNARGDDIPHSGQAQGSPDCDIGRFSVKPPQFGQLKS